MNPSNRYTNCYPPRFSISFWGLKRAADGDYVLHDLFCELRSETQDIEYALKHAQEELKTMQAEAIRRGHAEFVLNDDNEAEWRWKDQPARPSREGGGE